MKILIIPDSFKGSLTGKAVARAMERGVQSVYPNAECVLMPFSDGGEGALDVLQQHVAGTLNYCSTRDPLGRPIEAPYFRFKDQPTAWVELSQTAGLQNLTPEEYNPYETNTYGTGLMILHALEKGCTSIILGIGGSATHDMGSGIFSALGGRIFDQEGNTIPPNGRNLELIKRLYNNELYIKDKSWDLTIACDVSNPLLGVNGAAHTYAKQKGARPEMIERLEAGSAHFAGVIEQHFGGTITALAGGGAAGGVAAGLYGFFGAQLQNGFDLLASHTHLQTQIDAADLVITGEGRYDQQSDFGKLPQRIITLTQKKQIPTFLFCGSIEAKNTPRPSHLLGIEKIKPDTMPLDEAMKNAASLLEKKVSDTLTHYKNNPS